MSAKSIPSASHRRETICNWLSLLVLLSLGCAFSGSHAAAPYEKQSGTLLMKSSIDASPLEALRLSSSFHAQVTGTVARVYVSQQFINSSDDWMEGLYVFPLSVDAAVDELEMHVGGARDTRANPAARASTRDLRAVRRCRSGSRW